MHISTLGVSGVTSVEQILRLLPHREVPSLERKQIGFKTDKDEIFLHVCKLYIEWPMIYYKGCKLKQYGIRFYPH